jgi:hypothetical protein
VNDAGHRGVARGEIEASCSGTVAVVTDPEVRIPTVADTVRTYLVRSLMGDEGRWVRGLIWLPIIVLMILAIPRADSTDQWPIFPLLFLIGLDAVHAVDAARREYRFGGPRRLVVAAGVTTFVVALGILVTLIAVSIAFGPEPGSAPIETLLAGIPTNLVIGAVLLLMVAAAAAYRINEPARAREESENRARIRAERVARGRVVRE